MDLVQWEGNYCAEVQIVNFILNEDVNHGREIIPWYVFFGDDIVLEDETRHGIIAKLEI